MRVVATHITCRNTNSQYPHTAQNIHTNQLHNIHSAQEILGTVPIIVFIIPKNIKYDTMFSQIWCHS
jgi:hypothetical protein